MNIKRRIFYNVFSVLMVIFTGSIGYYLLFMGEPKFIDCIYMTVISITTVGYSEVIDITGNIPAQVFTMFLILCGMGVILYGISTLTAIIIEGELTGILRKKKMLKRIKKLKNITIFRMRISMTNG